MKLPIYPLCYRKALVYILLSICYVTLLIAQNPKYDTLGKYSFAYRIEHIVGQFETMNNSRIYYPDSSNQIPQSAVPCPIIVFGHGYLMDIDRYLSYAQHLASWGYIVVLPTISNPFPTPEHYTRAHSMVDAARWTANKNWVSTDIFYNKLDAWNWGFVGHSMGGGIALLAADTFKLNDTLKAVVSFASPQTTPATHSEHLLVPKMILAGSVDNIAPWQQIRQAYWQNAPAPGVFAVISGANHGYFMDYSYFWENGGTATISRHIQQKISRKYLTAYFERYLHNDISNWNFMFCYGDSIRNNPYMDSVEIRFNSSNLDEDKINIQLHPQYQIYPNPIKNYCIIKGNTSRAQLFSVTGYFITEINTDKVWYPDSKLKDGVYFLRFSNSVYIKLVVLK